jgi:hypothetical protein
LPKNPLLSSVVAPYTNENEIKQAETIIINNNQIE